MKLVIKAMRVWSGKLANTSTQANDCVISNKTKITLTSLPVGFLSVADSRVPQTINYHIISLSKLYCSFFQVLCCVDCLYKTRRRPHDGRRSSVGFTVNRTPDIRSSSHLAARDLRRKLTQTLDKRNFASTRMIPFPAHDCHLQCWSEAHGISKGFQHNVYIMYFNRLEKLITHSIYKK